MHRSCVELPTVDGGSTILAGVGKPKIGRKPKDWNMIDEHYETIRQDVFTLFQDLRIAA
jgi:hypothetical protein